MSANNRQVAGNHYQKSIQPWEIIEAHDLDFFEGNVLKYLLRYKDKNGVEDLHKAQHYLEKVIERYIQANRVSGVPYIPDETIAVRGTE